MVIWVIVADNSRARFFTAEKPAGPLTETHDLANPEARLHEGDLVSDKTGRDRNPSSGTAHGVGADASHKQEGADRFALAICEELDAARAAGTFQKLYILAAPPFLVSCANTNPPPSGNASRRNWTRTWPPKIWPASASTCPNTSRLPGPAPPWAASQAPWGLDSRDEMTWNRHDPERREPWPALRPGKPQARGGLAAGAGLAPASGRDQRQGRARPGAS
jgi:protein required for attachment to host cells